MQSMITAASIISRSASGSAYFPNSDSTRQRRASQPSTWSVIAATAKTIAGGPAVAVVRARVAATTNDRHSAKRSDRQRVRQLLIGAGTARRRRHGHARIGPLACPRKRRESRVARTLTCRASSTPTRTLPAPSARARRGRRLLGVARGDAREAERQTPETVRESTPRPTGRAARATRRSASSTISAWRRRSPRSRLPRRPGSSCGAPTAYGRGGLARFRQESPRRICARSSRCAGRAPRRARAPLRPGLPGRLARGDRPLRRSSPAAARPRGRAAA